jgi:hypothetical protein
MIHAHMHVCVCVCVCVCSSSSSSSTWGEAFLAGLFVGLFCFFCSCSGRSFSRRLDDLGVLETSVATTLQTTVLLALRACCRFSLVSAAFLSYQPLVFRTNFLRVCVCVCVCVCVVRTNSLD